ncbi:hypothetical protein [Candidatus Nitrosocosmicus franklandus]|uniref:hypothetical protein n=1 Tax=Candidatus Nitrosocosmicus franklandianus TaxID=1798806 RepID=UPI001559DE10|nr:hypothetical protein [Candidatus Nitrosocosmicus franklandus]
MTSKILLANSFFVTVTAKNPALFKLFMLKNILRYNPNEPNQKDIQVINISCLFGFTKPISDDPMN